MGRRLGFSLSGPGGTSRPNSGPVLIDSVQAPVVLGTRPAASDWLRTASPCREDDLSNTAGARSVVLELSHPLGPVARLDAPGPGPKTGRIVLAVPLKRPQLFDPHGPDGPV